MIVKQTLRIVKIVVSYASKVSSFVINCYTNSDLPFKLADPEVAVTSQAYLLSCLSGLYLQLYVRLLSVIALFGIPSFGICMSLYLTSEFATYLLCLHSVAVSSVVDLEELLLVP